MGLFLLLGAFAVGCGDKGGTSGGDSSSKPASTGDAKSGGDAKAGGGYAAYVDAYCACKGDMKCISDAGVKYKDSMGDAAKADVSVSKKLADCTQANPPKP